MLSLPTLSITPSVSTINLHKSSSVCALFKKEIEDFLFFAHQLIASFKSTLEEIKESDLLLHIVDATNADLGNYLRAVEEVLTEIGAINKKTVLVFNKIDLLDRVAL
ncbi:GTPase, partial [Candidatus Hakubella thermalkaliphila]